MVKSNGKNAREYEECNKRKYNIHNYMNAIYTK